MSSSLHEEAEKRNRKDNLRPGWAVFLRDWPPDLPGLDNPQDARPSLEVAFHPVEKYNDTLVVDTGALNDSGGVVIQFSEPIQIGGISIQAEIRIKGIKVSFDLIGKIVPGWRNDSLDLLLTKAYEFTNDTTYLIEIITSDNAGNQLRAKIQFHTSP